MVDEHDNQIAHQGAQPSTAALELILELIHEAEKSNPLMDEWQAAMNRVRNSEPAEWEPDDWEMAAIFVQRRSTPEPVRATLIGRLAKLFDNKSWVFKEGSRQHREAKAELLVPYQLNNDGCGRL